MALGTPFDRIGELVDSSYNQSNPAFSGEMSYGNFNLKKNYSAAGESAKVKVNASRLINEKSTKDKDILSILYSITNNLSLALEDEDLNDHDIERMREAVGDAIFERSGLETEIGNYIANQVEASFDQLFQDHSMSGAQSAMGRFT
jgi:hypothetical protein